MVFLSALKSSIILFKTISYNCSTECTLKEVIYTDNKATVTYDSPKGPITEEFDYVVIAIPFSLVNLVNFSPPLPIRYGL